MSGAVAIVAGSGIDLLPMFDEISEEAPFARFGGAGTTVPGHARTFVIGRACGRDVIVQRGRFHFYEGLTQEEVTAPVDWLRGLGAASIIFTNAVGGIAPNLRAGGLVGVTALHAWPCARYAGPREVAPDKTLPHSDATGPYWWLHGPCYETRAEIAALRALGACVVGMSTLPEVVRAKELGIETAVISCVTNICGSAGPVTHDEVVRVSTACSSRLAMLLRNHLSNVG